MNDSIALKLIIETKTHEEFMQVMEFGRDKLLQDQPTLLECVYFEDARQAYEPSNYSKKTIGEYANEIFNKMGIHVTFVIQSFGTI